ncbi:hypothetical protein GGR56DRAFT_567805 [Xylariaceae sp. FL0804]|nr:hypothetical protein GGR56DRAFT_567805 [Xylariaceae sp. FL0804]
MTPIMVRRERERERQCKARYPSQALSRGRGLSSTDSHLPLRTILRPSNDRGWEGGCHDASAAIAVRLTEGPARRKGGKAERRDGRSPADQATSRCARVTFDVLRCLPRLSSTVDVGVGEAAARGFCAVQTSQPRPRHGRASRSIRRFEKYSSVRLPAGKSGVDSGRASHYFVSRGRTPCTIHPKQRAKLRWPVWMSYRYLPARLLLPLTTCLHVCAAGWAVTSMMAVAMVRSVVLLSPLLEASAAMFTSPNRLEARVSLRSCAVPIRPTPTRRTIES